MSPRARRILVGACSFVIALIVAVPVAFWLLFDEQQLRAQASRYVKEKTGRELSLNGPIRVMFFPWLGARVHDIAIGQPGESGGRPSARFTELDLKVRFIPLLHRVIEVGAVRGRGGTVWLPGYELRDLEVTTGSFGGSSETALSAGFRLAPEAGGAVPVDLASRMVFDIPRQRLDFLEVAGRVGEASLSGELRGRRVLDAPAFEGRFQTGSFDLRKLLAQLGTGYSPADASAMTAAALSARVAATPDRIALRDVAASLDGSSLKGSVTGTTPSGGRGRAWDAQLSVDRFNLDRYLPAPAGARASPAGAAPFHSLRELDARVRLEIRQLRALDLQLTNVVAAAAAREGTIAVTPIRGELYGGRADLAARMSVRGAVPEYQVEGRFAGVNVRPLLADAQEITALSGTGDVSIRIGATGDPAVFLQGARGEVSLSLRDGRIEGADFLRLLTQARTLADRIQGRPVTVRGDPANRTKFTRLTATAVLARGVASNDDMTLEAPDLQATGSGTIDLARDTMDYLVRAASDQAGNVTVPIAIAGPFGSPTYRIETATMLKDALRDELRKQLEKRGLKGLFRKKP